jgi:SAM-dependent methyltransferase
VSWLTPPVRQHGVEILDSPDVDPRVRRRSHRDIALANTLFGGLHAMRAEFASLLAGDTGTELSLLDIGTGTGDIPASLARLAARRHVRVRVLGLDNRTELIAATRDWPVAAVCGDARSLPFPDHSIDVVCCSQTLHHFEDREAAALLAEMHRVARRRVIVADLRRSRLAAILLWSASFPLGFHAVSRHDGVVSIRRGFTTDELAGLVRRVTGNTPRVSRRLFFRLTASWTPVNVT